MKIIRSQWLLVIALALSPAIARADLPISPKDGASCTGKEVKGKTALPNAGRNARGFKVDCKFTSKEKEKEKEKKQPYSCTYVANDPHKCPTYGKDGSGAAKVFKDVAKQLQNSTTACEPAQVVPAVCTGTNDATFVRQ